MADFTFTGERTKEIWKCDECGWLSTKKHFRDGPRCTLCNSPASQIDTQTQDNSMPTFQYRQILGYLEDEVDGVGSGTVSSIEDTFDDGDEFLDVVRDAYETQAYGPLTEVSGIGESTARKIALGIAEQRGWENGAAEVSFTVAT